MLLLRHGQSEFNVIYGKTRQDPRIRDPILTVKGRAQANDAAKQLTRFAADRIVSSPYRRTLETSSIIAAQLKLPITVTPLIAERAVFHCDIGSPASQLRSDFPHIDFLNINKETWWHPGNEDLDSLDRRCAQFRKNCKDCSNNKSIFVTHWGFILGLTNIRAQNCDIVSFDPKSIHPGGGRVVYSCNPC
ncbi:MAG: phosphoglycerate mutase [Rhodospirillaceae bacterium]|nr:phosphoglycerate mutase [Rhodospirillaceae bacterium]|tara:strand:- start:168 stop:737 length:570 start_codon:yes stop_codon:yes gene_type:complete